MMTSGPITIAAGLHYLAIHRGSLLPWFMLQGCPYGPLHPHGCLLEGTVDQNGYSPETIAINARLSGQDQRPMEQARLDGNNWGRLVESDIGAHLLNSNFDTSISVTYSRERNQEVDFVQQKGKTTVVIEVNSGVRRETPPGMETFVQQFKPARQLLIGGQGIAIKNFFPDWQRIGANELGIRRTRSLAHLIESW